MTIDYLHTSSRPECAIPLNSQYSIVNYKVLSISRLVFDPCGHYVHLWPKNKHFLTKTTFHPEYGGLACSGVFVEIDFFISNDRVLSYRAKTEIENLIGQKQPRFACSDRKTSYRQSSMK
jgi:hypothetical protein